MLLGQFARKFIRKTEKGKWSAEGLVTRLHKQLNLELFEII